MMITHWQAGMPVTVPGPGPLAVTYHDHTVTGPGTAAAAQAVPGRRRVTPTEHLADSEAAGHSLALRVQVQVRD
eukprot:2057093-Rhodomonas_salina.2